MVKYTISGFADEMYDDFEQQLRGHKSLGLNRIDLRRINGKNISELSGAEVAETFRLLHVYKIRPYSIGSPIGKISLDCDLEEHYELARRIFHMAHVLGAKYVRVFSFYPREGKEFDRHDRDVIAAFLKRLAETARFYRITVGLENEKGLYGESPERVRELLDLVNMEKLRCVFDMGNFVNDGHDPEKAYRLLSDYVTTFHIKDVTKAKEMVMTGQGDAKIAEILAAHYALRDGGETFISLEPHLTDKGDRAAAYIAAADKLKNIVENIK